MKVTKQEREECLNRLKEWVKEGDTIFCVLRSVSRSGMSRKITFLKIENDQLNYLTYDIAKSLGYHYHSEWYDSMTVSDWGMDMGFAVVDRLSCVLFGKHGKLKCQWL